MAWSTPWGRRKTTPATTAQGEAAGEDSELGQSAGEVHHSKAIAQLESDLRGREGLRVMDLGPAVPRNVNWVTGFAEQLTVIDLRGHLCSPGPGATVETLFAGAREAQPFDCVLAWDLFDYLDPDTRLSLGAYVAEMCRSRARFYGFCSYREDIADRPRIYRLGEGETLEGTAHEGKTVPSPRLKEPELLRALPGFETERSFLLRSGVQEYVLRKG